jgi:Tol biopolymer transport system component
MRKLYIYLWILSAILLLSACSTGSTSVTSTPAGTTPTAPLQTAASTTATQPTSTGNSPAWVQLGFTGRLILILSNPKGNKLEELDLASGNTTILFQAPEFSWLGAAVVSPDGKQILLAYAPPIGDGKAQFGYTDLDLMPLSGASPPQPLLTRKDPQESFFNPSWAPDGKSIYYTHLYRLDPNSKVPAYQNDVEHATLDGKTKRLIPHSLWPVPSPDGARLAYLNADPATFTNDIYLSNLDGSHPIGVIQPNIGQPVDDHFFTKDGGQLILSMVNPQPAPSRYWWEKLFGIEVASAHNIPSDWYMVSANGGEPYRLTNFNAIGMYGHLSPDGRKVAFISASGLYIMNGDGSSPTMLSDQVYIGTVDWIP